MNSLAENIKRFRLAKGLTQEQLANILHISSQAISKWECDENFPDGSLLIPLANALEVSLDRLFGNEKIYFEDTSLNIIKLLQNSNNEYKLALDLCWQIEQGVFGWLDSTEQINKCPAHKFASYVLRNEGFTHMSTNNKSSFFSIFPEPECGWSEALGDIEELRKIFECMADPDTMNSIIFIHKIERGYTFEAEVLCSKCGVDSKCLEKVIESLLYLKLVSRDIVTIDNKELVLYTAHPTHKIIPLLLFAKALFYDSGYSMQADSRNTPFFK